MIQGLGADDILCLSLDTRHPTPRFCFANWNELLGVPTDVNKEDSTSSERPQQREIANNMLVIVSLCRSLLPAIKQARATGASKAYYPLVFSSSIYVAIIPQSPALQNNGNSNSHPNKQATQHYAFGNAQSTRDCPPQNRSFNCKGKYRFFHEDRTPRNTK